MNAINFFVNGIYLIDVVFCRTILNEFFLKNRNIVSIYDSFGVSYEYIDETKKMYTNLLDVSKVYSIFSTVEYEGLEKNLNELKKINS